MSLQADVATTFPAHDPAGWRLTSAEQGPLAARYDAVTGGTYTGSGGGVARG